MGSYIQNSRKSITKIIGYIATIISLIFIIKTFADMNVDWRQFQHPSRSLLILSLFSVLFVLGYIALGYDWKLLLSFTSGEKIDTRLAIGIYLRANIGKYLPGNIMQFAGRNLLGSRMNIRQIDIVVSTFLEIALTALSAFLVVIIFAFRYLLDVANIVLQNRIYFSIFWAVIVICILIIVGVIVYHRKYPNCFEKYKYLFSLKFLKVIFKVVPVYVGTMVLYGLISIGIIAWILGQPVAPENVVSAVALYILSWLAGFVIPGVPGGIGIREAISILLLSKIYSTDTVALAAVILRVATILSDILAFLVGIVYFRCPANMQNRSVE